MKRAIKGLMLFLICLVPMAVSGCWGYRDIGDEFVVMGAAINMDPNTNMYAMEIEILQPAGGKEGEMKVQEVTGRGVTVMDAIRDGIVDAGGRLYWGHAEVWVISQEIAESEGILSVLDMVSRSVEFRSDTAILIMERNSLERLIGSNTERTLHDSISQHINQMLTEYQRAGIFTEPHLWQVLSNMEEEEEALTLPLLEVYQKDGKETMGIRGTAIFRGDKMVGEITPEQSEYLYMLNGGIEKEYVVCMSETTELPRMTLEVKKAEKNVKITMEGEAPKAAVVYKIEGALHEFESSQNYINPQGIGNIENAFAAYIQDNMYDVVQAAQKKYGSDIFGWGRQVHIQALDYYNKVRGHWNDAFRDMEVQIDVNVNITRTGLDYGPLTVSGGK